MRELQLHVESEEDGFAEPGEVRVVEYGNLEAGEKRGRLSAAAVWERMSDEDDNDAKWDGPRLGIEDKLRKGKKLSRRREDDDSDEDEAKVWLDASNDDLLVGAKTRIASRLNDEDDE